MIIDAHAHVWPRWPHRVAVADLGSRGSVENLLFEMDTNGVDRALLVSARLLGTEDNNEYGEHAVASHDGRFYHFVDVDSRWSPDYHRPGSADRLRSLLEKFEPIGISHYLGSENDGWLTSRGGIAFFAAAAERPVMVSLAASPPWFPDLRRIARQFPEIVFVVNHLGGVGTHSAGLDEALSMVLDDHDVPNLLVKISGLHYGSPRPWDYPYLDRIRIVKRFYESWGPRRMVWASDFPMLLPFTSYRQSLELLREHASFIEASELPCILGGTLFAILSRLSKA